MTDDEAVNENEGPTVAIGIGLVLVLMVALVSLCVALVRFRRIKDGIRECRGSRFDDDERVKLLEDDGTSTGRRSSLVQRVTNAI